MKSVLSILILIAICGLATFLVLKALRQGLIPVCPHKDKPFHVQFVDRSTNPLMYGLTIGYCTLLGLMSFTCLIILLYRALKSEL